MFDTLYAQVGAAAVVLVAAFGFLRGGEPERVGAAVCAVGLLASLLVQDDARLRGPQWGLMIVDAGMLAAYVGVAWKSRRSWPVWAAALQSLVVMCHLLTLIDRRPPILAFYAVMNLASYGILLALAVGVWSAWRDHRAALA